MAKKKSVELEDVKVCVIRVCRGAGAFEDWERVTKLLTQRHTLAEESDQDDELVFVLSGDVNAYSFGLKEIIAAVHGVNPGFTVEHIEYKPTLRATYSVA